MADSMIYFDKLENRYLIKGKLKATGALHIGSGLGDENSDAKVMSMNGKPYLPGSSLKGYLRSNLERMVATLEDKAGFAYNTCLLNKEYASDDVECATADDDLSKKLQKAKAKNTKQYFNKLNDKLCSICKLFGSKEMASKVKITDAFLVSDRADISVRDGIAIDRDTGTTKKGAKFDYEVVEKGAEFAFELIAENLAEGELGLIALAMLDLINDSAAIGGNTSKGLGQVKLELEEIECFEDSTELVNYLSSGKMKSKNQPEKFLQKQLKDLMDEVS